MTRKLVPAGSAWGDIVGYSRAVRVGDLVFVSGTTAASDDGSALHAGDPGAQTELILQRIGAALQAVGCTIEDIVETRVFVSDISRWEEVGRVHGAHFGTTRPATAMVEVSRLISQDIMVEISAVAVAGTAVRSAADRL